MTKSGICQITDKCHYISLNLEPHNPRSYQTWWMEPFENVVGKGEKINAGYQHFLFFPHVVLDPIIYKIHHFGNNYYTSLQTLLVGGGVY